MSIVDRRGSWQILAQQIIATYEGGLPPWQRYPRKSNGKLIRALKVIRPIRGVHTKTFQMRHKP